MLMLERFYDELTSNIPDRSKIVPVNITSASDWFFEYSDKEEWDNRDDFPMITPPFPLMWMEFRSPNFINSAGRQSEYPREIESTGCMSVCFPIKESESRKVIENGLLRSLVERHAGGGPSSNTNPDEDKARIKKALDNGREARWIAMWHVFAVNRYRRSVHHIDSTAAYIDPNGQMVTECFYVMASESNIQARYQFNGSFGGGSLQPFLFATSLMHAKNVSLEDDPLPASFAKRRAKDGKPVLTFKVLRIEPMRKQAKQESKPGESGTKRAMHIVRGHFKDYRNSGGLFGKYKGLYWWDMHVAGDVANGQVVKDYAIGEVNP